MPIKFAVKIVQLHTLAEAICFFDAFCFDFFYCTFINRVVVSHCQHLSVICVMQSRCQYSMWIVVKSSVTSQKEDQGQNIWDH